MQMEVRKYNRHALALVEPEALEPSSADVDALPVRVVLLHLYTTSVPTHIDRRGSLNLTRVHSRAVME